MARPRVHDDALRTRLLEEASAIVATAGADALTVRDLAARAGTSASAVYSLFGSRRGPGACGRRRGVRAVRRAPRRCPPHRRSGAPTCSGSGSPTARTRSTDPHFYRVMFSAAGAGLQDGTRGPATASATFTVLRDAVARVLGGGALRCAGAGARAVGAGARAGRARAGRDAAPTARRNGTPACSVPPGRGSSAADLLVSAPRATVEPCP